MQNDRPTWRSGTWAVAAVLLAMLVVAFMVAGFDGAPAALTSVTIAVAVVAAVVVWAMVRTRRQRHRYEQDLAAWAAQQAAQAERLRIARDLHDLASHGLGTITMRAAAARTGGQQEHSAALGDIETASRQATTELRRMLTLLRGADSAPLRPAETFDDLPAIAQDAERFGVEVRLDTGGADDVSPGVQLTVCAIVREALRNTARHAGPARARVAVHRRGDTIAVEIRDDGGAPEWSAQPGAGFGLQGLRERVAALEGSLEAGPADGGWALTARLPDRTAA